MSELTKEQLEAIKKFAENVGNNLEELIENEYQQKVAFALKAKEKLKELYNSKLFEEYLTSTGEDKYKIGMQIDMELEYPFSIGDGFIQNITGAFDRDAESVDESYSPSNYIINSYAEMIADGKIEAQRTIKNNPSEHKF